MTTTVDISSFQAALKRHLAVTSRDLQTAIRMRLAYVVHRAGKHLEPQDIRSKRAAVRAYLMEVIESRGKTFKSGKRKGQANTARDHIRAHRIIQSGRYPGLYGKEMQKATRAFISKTIKSIGYMRAALGHALTKLMGTVTIVQNGKRTRVFAQRFAQIKGKAIKPAATSRSTIANGTGWNPSSEVFVELLKVGDGQQSKVDARYSAALQKAFNEERDEILRHIGATALDGAEQSGFLVK